MTRFSGKELAKNAKNAIIPSNYSELKNANLLAETDLSYRIEFVLNGHFFIKYFPKSHCFYSLGKYYASNWIIETKINE